MRQSWLIIGHGSVGGSLVARLLATSGSIYVYDPQPRIGVPGSDRVVPIAGGPLAGLDYVAVCVPPSASMAAAQFIRDAVRGAPTVFDWTSALPATKKQAASLVEGAWVDVALLDSLDKEDESALVAISGQDASAHAGALEDLTFDVVVVGPEVGQAAQTKLVRSLFMKGLEALVIEARSIAARLDSTGTAWESVERNLGPAFAEFADLLVLTDANHALRRSAEIGEAVEFARAKGLEPLMGAAAWEALSRLAALWRDSALPDLDGAGTALLLQHAVRVFSDGHHTPVSTEPELGQ